MAAVWYQAAALGLNKYPAKAGCLYTRSSGAKQTRCSHFGCSRSRWLVSASNFVTPSAAVAS